MDISKFKLDLNVACKSAQGFISIFYGKYYQNIHQSSHYIPSNIINIYVNMLLKVLLNVIKRLFDCIGFFLFITVELFNDYLCVF